MATCVLRRYGTFINLKEQEYAFCNQSPCKRLPEFMIKAAWIILMTIFCIYVY